MGFFFTRIYDFLKKNKLVLYSLFFITLAFFLFFGLRIKFEEDISAIIPKDAKTEKLTEVFQNSKFADKLAVIVSLKDTSAIQPDSLVMYADAFASALQDKAPDYIKNIHYKVEDDFTMELFQSIQDHLPVFLSESDYKKIDSLIRPENLKETLEQDIRLLSSPSGFALKNIIVNDPTGISFIALQKLRQLQYDDNFELYDNHIVAKDQRSLMIFITPAYPSSNTGKNAIFFQQLDNIIDSLGQSGFAAVNATYFGAAAVSLGNAKQLRTDTFFTQGITVLFLVLFISFFFKKKRAPLLVLIPVVYGAAFSLACVYFLKGSISVIALATGSVVLGIAVNYSLHVFNHHRHTEDIREAIRELAFPLTIGSFTTIGGFFCLEFVQSDMLRDIGLFAGCSLIGAALCSLIFLPHFIGTKKDRSVAVNERYGSWIDKIALLRPEYNRWLVLVIIVLTVVFAFFVNKVRFEPDMTSLNYMSPKLKEAERQLNDISGSALRSLYLVTEGKNLEEALRRNEQLQDEVSKQKDEGNITSATNVSSVFISDSLQKARIAYWDQYWTAEKKSKLLADLRQQGEPLKFRATAFDHFSELLNKTFESVDTSVLDGIRKNFLDDYITEKPGEVSVVTLLKVSPDKRKEIVEYFDNRENTTILDRQYLTNRLTEIVNDDFSKIAWLTSGLVFIVLLLTFGRIELALVAFVPMLVSWIWILGIMAFASIHFNIVNIIVSALIFGLGDDYSLFIMDGLLQEYKTGKKNLSSYKSSILLSAITTIAGLGVLIFAKHPALRSIAFISVTGIVCVVIMSQVLIPFLYSLLIKNRVKKGFFPWTAWAWIRSMFALLYFVIGILLLTVAGLLLIYLNPFSREKGKRLYHILFSKTCWSILYIMGNVKKRIINPLQEKLDKPAIVIANHQSFLDILLFTALSPKLVLLTNKRVWSSQLLGAAIRMADFYSVEGEAMEDSGLNKVKQMVSKGYSVVIFPEGTRSNDGKIKRFHKGAFYLAGQLQMDILPVILHGTGYTMTKKDLLLKDGTISAKYLPRIPITDTSFGNTYSERTKQISRYFKNEYEKLRQELEQPVYFKEQLIYNYLYKGPVLEWYMKVKIRLDKYYQQFNDLLPKQGKLLDIGCGYGFMSYMLHFTSEAREITGIDYDEDKIATANHCFSKNEKIRFYYKDVLDFSFEKYNGIVISDVLHYLQPDEQNLILQRCIQSLLPGGVLVIRDGDSDMKTKHKGTQLTELFSTRILNFNKTKSAGLSFISGKKIRDTAKEHGMHFSRIDETKYTSNVIFVLKKSLHEI